VKLVLLVAGVVSIVTGLAAGASGLPSSGGVVERSLAVSQTQIEMAYTLGGGDRIRIDILQIPQYSGESSVLVDGTLNLSAAGSIDVQGLTLEQAAKAIAARYTSARILRDPDVTVSLITPRPLKISVIGEVSRPGSYTTNRENAQFPTVAEILETAGGVRQSADLRQVQIRRLQRSGGEQLINVDLWQFLQTGNLQYNLTLRDGDTVYVPTATDINLAESPQVAASSFAPKEETPINIAVVGEVYRPGPYTVNGSARTAEAGVPGGTNQTGLSSTVTRAIQVAGGITPTADIRRIQIRRVTRTGTEQVFDVDLWQLLQGGDLSQDAILQDRDTVFVPTATATDPAEANQIAAASFSPDTIRVNVVGEVPHPGVVEVPPNTPLNQGLLAAGGFNNRANRNTVELIRLNLNGSVSRQRIRVDFAQGVNESINPPLRNNDVIIVQRSQIAAASDTLETITDPIARFFTLFSLPLNFFRLF
jgi:polysaccharide export outer membrane protein